MKSLVLILLFCFALTEKFGLHIVDESGKYYKQIEYERGGAQRVALKDLNDVQTTLSYLGSHVVMEEERKFVEIVTKDTYQDITILYIHLSKNVAQMKIIRRVCKDLNGDNCQILKNLK
jgi:hypothetical protein